MLELRGVMVRRGARRTFGPVDLEVGSGELLGVVGPNGAGKSTLLDLLSGRLRPTSGERRLSGSAGYLLQHHDYLPDLPFTVEDVVLFGRLGRGRVPARLGARDREAARLAMERTTLSGFERRLYRELSGGERRKVHLARLVAQGADLLLLDEPGSGLDLDWQERLVELVGSLHREGGRTIVMVSHEVHLLPRETTRVMLLEEGRVVALGPPPEVLTSERLTRLYRRTVDVEARCGRYHALRR